MKNNISLFIFHDVISIFSAMDVKTRFIASLSREGDAINRVSTTITHAL